VHVHVVDPSAYTPPYDHALCRALAQAGADVELYTSRFPYARVPPAQGYAVHEFFYRRSSRVGDDATPSRARSAAKLLEHVPDMLRYRRAAPGAQLVHFQWLSVQQLDAWLLPPRVPLVLTAHDILPHQPGPGQRAAQRRLYARVDAVVVHSRRGRERLIDEAGVDPDRIEVIPHGVLQPDRETPASLPPELAGHDARPVVLFFGLLRPYKGIEVLLEAWRGIDDAQLWIVGMPRMDIAAPRAAATAASNVRFVPRFVAGPELAACFLAADVAVLPYLRADQSGVLNTALAFETPLLVSDVGGFNEIAELGAARLVPPGDANALRDGLRALLHDPAARASLSAAARAAAIGPLSWDAIAAQTLALYERLLERRSEGQSPA
jgi:glycosyltransferase involved in cell wall biosynthesis